MNNTDKLYKNVEESNLGVNIKGNSAYIKLKQNVINATTIKKLLSNLKYLKKFKHINIVIININAILFIDDATVSVLEIILYDLLKNDCSKIKLNFKNLKKDYFQYNFYKNSLIYEKKILNNEYINSFEKKKKFDMNSYRTIMHKQQDRQQLSIIYSDIATFFVPHMINEQFADNISEMICEIAGNAIDHSDSDCLIQIKLFDVINNKHKKFKVLNIVTINISDIRLGQKLKEKILSGDITQQNMIVEEAYNNHRKYFNDIYDIDVFSLISSFQRYVTTRDTMDGSGGTGLTKLIQYLIGNTYENYCYVKSGINTLLFTENNLKLNEDGTIGFNETNDYRHDIPNNKNFTKNKMDFNGTIYNLTLILKGDE